MRHLLTTVLAFALILGAVSSVCASSALIVAVDSTAIRNQSDTIISGTTMRVYVTFANTDTARIVGATNGWRVYSPDGATWSTTNLDSIMPTTHMGHTQWPDFWAYTKISINGAGADTVGWAAACFSPSNPAVGLQPGTTYDSALVVSFGPIPTGESAGNHRKTICIDTSYFPIGGEWLWGFYPDGIPPAYPDWNGPKCWTIWDEQTGVDDNGSSQLPLNFSLSQNYPNPFNPSTEISFSIKEKSNVTLTVYNVLGQEVRTLVNSERSAGNYTELWDGTDNHGKLVTTGVYFYKLQAGNWTQTRKMAFVK